MYIGFWFAGQYADANKTMDSLGETTGHNWQKIWLMPCIFAAGVALMFFVFFKNNKKAIA